MAKKLDIYPSNELGLKVFNYIYKKYGDNKNHLRFKETEKNIKILNYFCSIYHNKIKSTNFWYNYICFQFSFYKDSNHWGKNMVPWIFGKKAIERWRSKPEYYLQYVYEFNKSIGASVVDLLNEETDSFNSDEILKQIFWKNQSDIFILCQSKTKGFDTRSRFCKKCKYHERCSEIKKSISRGFK